MSQQFDLPVAVSITEPTDHLFLAIYPDTETATRIAGLANRLRAEHALRGKPLATDLFHVTLYSLGIFSGVPEVVVRATSDAAETVASMVQPFKVEFDRAGSFSGRRRHRPFVLRDSGNIAELIEFCRSLGAALVGCGVSPNRTSGFTPHVTLLYDEQAIAEKPVEIVSWTAREFVLVHSLLGKSRHIPLARWMLRGRPA